MTKFLCAVALLSAASATAQIQQAWIAHYNNGITNGTNATLKMALDSAGNIVVTGVSQNTNGGLGYATIKYAPNGNQLWATRYDSTNYPHAAPTAMSLDSSNNIFVTGSALTIKYDTNGNQLWTAPYAGLAVGCDLNGNSFVTGFGTNFNTVKLSPAGGSLRSTSYSDAGAVVGQSIAVDARGNVCVSGSDIFGNYPGDFNPGFTVLTIKYDTNGSQLWLARDEHLSLVSVQVVGSAFDMAGDVVVAACGPYEAPYFVAKYSSEGAADWTVYDLTGNVNSKVGGLALDHFDNVIVTGANAHHYYPYAVYGTYKLDTNGVDLWVNIYPVFPTSYNQANAVAVDSADNSYVTGFSPGTNSANDIVTIAYGPNGNQLWLQRYSGPGIGNAAGNAIAVDKSGNVYVAGYDTTAAGGTEMVLIKYSPLVLQMQTNGAFLLQAQGSPGENFTIQASPDLIHWQNLGTATADTNGLMQFTDTNAPNYPARFYNTIPQ